MKMMYHEKYVGEIFENLIYRGTTIQGKTVVEANSTMQSDMICLAKDQQNRCAAILVTLEQDSLE